VNLGNQETIAEKFRRIPYVILANYVMECQTLLRGVFFLGMVDKKLGCPQPSPHVGDQQAGPNLHQQ
jgi:hypothetical protein